MNWSKLWRLVLAALVLALMAGGLFLHKEALLPSDYVASGACLSCHPVQYHAWKGTLHSKMFRPVKGPEDLLGDFTTNDPAVTFKPEEVEFVLGNKWEQLYVRRIDGEYYHFPAKWLVAQRRWVPFSVDTWRETPMSTQCNGCHTTGFDPATHEFNEFSIGCEACHGPGRDHVQNRKIAQEPVLCAPCHDAARRPEPGKDIIRSVSPSICAQCHDRGANKGGATPGAFNFPVNFKPGDDIGQAFASLGPEQDKKGKYWWGIGVSRNRHQEYADWNLSGHSKSLENLLAKQSEVCPDSGLREACLHCHSTDYRHAPADRKPTLDDARYGVTCVACHDPHGIDRQSDQSLRGNAVCGDCHMANLAIGATGHGRPHTPCPGNAVHCEDCHMPRVVETGGFFSLRSHAFRIIPPHRSRDGAMPNSCQNGGCHADRDLDWAIQAFDAHYPDFSAHEAAKRP